jgi:hypothetical protein
MKNWKQILGITGVLAGLALILIPFSLIIGWSVISLISFWFIIVPLFSFIIPHLIPGNRLKLLQSIIGMILFYGIMIFMIYKQSETDYFRAMAVSGIVNLILLLGFNTLVTKSFKKGTTVPNTR